MECLWEAYTPLKGNLPALEEECSDKETFRGANAGILFTCPFTMVG